MPTPNVRVSSRPDPRDLRPLRRFLADLVDLMDEGSIFAKPGQLEIIIEPQDAASLIEPLRWLLNNQPPSVQMLIGDSDE